MDLKNFEKKIGITFKNKGLLQQAFVHRSYINENKDSGLAHNERLEFLGDAVLELVTTEFLYAKFPTKTEGDLTSYRSALVNTTTISHIASGLKMNDYLLLSKGETKDMGRARQYILANTFEAFIGAVYLDQGYEFSKKFIAENLFPIVDKVVNDNLWRDAKSLLQERAQELLNVTPSYKTISEVGPDHNKVFTIGLYFGEELVSEGRGHSKQEAEQESAKKALEKNDWA
ncbi:MAG: ribonuclease III [Patescibacteria group bacterium]